MTTSEVDFSHIIVTYLGNKMPNYVKHNLIYLRDTFPDKKVVLISDNIKNLTIAKRINIEEFAVKPWHSWLSTLGQLNHPKKFRNGFWLLTLYRFKAIESFLQHKPSISVLQVEADVLLSSNFNITEILKPEVQLAYPSVSEYMACPSVMFIRNLDSINKFLNFIEVKVKSNPFTTDMLLLSEYAKLNGSSVLSLNSEPNHIEKYVFDAATYGMFLTGIDPRNNRGILKLFSDVDSHSIKPSEYFFRIEKNQLIVGRDGTFSELLCLHIHCKDVSYFSGSWPPKKLVSRIRQSIKGPRVEVNLRIFLKLFLMKGFKVLKTFVSSNSIGDK